MDEHRTGQSIDNAQTRAESDNAQTRAESDNAQTHAECALEDERRVKPRRKCSGATGRDWSKTIDGDGLRGLD